MRESKGLLASMHVADSNTQAVGEGHTDFRVGMTTLRGIGYQGALALEPLLPVSDPHMATGLPRYRMMLYLHIEKSIRQLKGHEAEVLGQL